MKAKIRFLVLLAFFSFCQAPSLLAVETDLEILLEEENEEFIESLLLFLVSQGADMKSLEADFLVHTNVDKPNNFLRKNNKKISDFTKRMSVLQRHLKRNPAEKLKDRPVRPAKFNIYFFGNYELAVDANVEATALYKEALAIIEKLMVDEQQKFHGVMTGNLNTLRDCHEMVSDLFHYHRNNRQIGLQAYHTGESPTYYNLAPARSRAVIHWDKTQDAHPYEVRAELMYTIFERAYRFAVAHDLVMDMFNFLTKAQGCLEARLTRLNEWWMAKSVIVEKRLKASAAAPARKSELERLLEKSAKETAFEYIEKNWELISEEASDPEGKRKIIKRISKTFADKVDEDGNRVTAKLIKSCLEELLRSPFPTPDVTPVTTPEKKQTKKIEVREPIAGTRRGLFLDDADSEQELIETIAQQVGRIRRIELADGRILNNARMIRMVADGDCGFEALGIDRAGFIQQVVQAYLEPSTNRLLFALIDLAIADARIEPGDINGWVERFRSPGYWMEDIHIEIFAMIHHRPVEIYGVDRRNTTFYHLRTIGARQNEIPIRILNRTLLPTNTQEDRPLNGNHFDRIVLDEDVAQPLLVPGALAQAAALLLTGVWTRHMGPKQ